MSLRDRLSGMYAAHRIGPPPALPPVEPAPPPVDRSVVEREQEHRLELAVLNGALRHAEASLAAALERNISLQRQVRDLAAENVRLRQLPYRAADTGEMRCPECLTPMQFGMAHYCPRTSTYRPERTAA